MNCEDYRAHHDLLRDYEKGRTVIPPRTLSDLRDHARSCADCRAEDAFAKRIADDIARLPGYALPRGFSFSPPARSHRWIAPFAAAAASLICLAIMPPKDDPPEKIVYRSAARTDVRIVDDRRVRLDTGSITVKLAPDQILTIDTPSAQLRARGAEFLVSVDSSIFPPPLAVPEASLMNDTMKTALVSACVSVLVTTGTVTMINSLGEKDANALEIVRSKPGEAPELTSMNEAMIKLESTIERQRNEIQSLQSRLDNQNRDVERRFASLATATKQPTDGATSQPVAEVPIAERVKKAREKLASILAGQNIQNLATSGKLADFADDLKDLGPEGLELIRSGFESKDPNERFAAAMLAGRLNDPAFIAPLEKSAVEDDNFIVRRMASHALGHMGRPETADSLVNIVKKEKDDSGVRINAWYGLATLKSPESPALFDHVFERSGGDVPPDFVVAIGMKFKDPNLSPSFRKAYDDKRISDATRIDIIRRLGDDSNRAYDDFLRGLAADQGAGEAIRKAASEALQR